MLPNYIYSAFFFLIGIGLGSFFNVVILRLVQEKSILGRSRCPDCGTQLKWYENIPLLSFSWLRGKCHNCHKPISWQYPLVELASGMLWLVGWLAFGDVLLSIIFGIFASFLLILFVFDARWYILPDVITLSGIVVAFAINLYLGKDWRWLLIATVAGALWFGIQYAVSKGKWVGSGDIRLGALIGAMVAGWQGLLLVFMLAYFGGALISIPLLAIKKKNLKSEMPFGVFLTAATVVVLLWGEQIWQWYMGVLW